MLITKILGGPLCSPKCGARGHIPCANLTHPKNGAISKNPRIRVMYPISSKPLQPLVQKDCIETRGTEGRIPDFRRIFVHSCSHPDHLRASTIAAHQHIQTSTCCHKVSHAPILRLILEHFEFSKKNSRHI